MNDQIPPEPPHHSPEDIFPTFMKRFVPVMLTIGAGVTLVGFILGIREPRKTERTPRPASGQTSNAPPAPSYTELASANLRPNPRGKESLTQLKFDKPGIFDPVTRTEEMKLAALADRARNRAFDGAPPTIPHPVDAQSAASCLACHQEGLIVGGRVASKISHPLLTNCTQCHVEQSSATVENGFLGVYRAGPGERATPGAPPTIPHPIWLRENCTSCHGLIARPGIRTTHPWLTNCTQCHAPRAELDQLHFLQAGK